MAESCRPVCLSGGVRPRNSWRAPTICKLRANTMILFILLKMKKKMDMKERVRSGRQKNVKNSDGAGCRGSIEISGARRVWVAVQHWAVARGGRSVCDRVPCLATAAALDYRRENLGTSVHCTGPATVHDPRVEALRCRYSRPRDTPRVRAALAMLPPQRASVLSNRCWL
jgi:hypothetical protein